MTVQIEKQVLTLNVVFECEVTEWSSTTMVPYGSTSVPYETDDYELGDTDWNDYDFTADQNNAIRSYLNEHSDEIEGELETKFLNS